MKPTIQDIPFSKINPAPYNPRQRLATTDHEYQTIKNSLKEFGLVQVLVWNKRTGNLVGGHIRFDILKADGEKSAPCFVVDLPIEKEKALNITLNNPNVGGNWEDVSLANILREIEAQMPDLYDGLNMAPLTQEVDLPLRGGMENGEGEPELEEGIGPPEMELLPYEHYDYIVLFFKDSRDFLAAADHFGLEKMKVPGYVGKKTIGLGRVVDGGKFLDRIKRSAGHNSKPKAG
jgi:ParB-like nuclease domain